MSERIDTSAYRPRTGLGFAVYDLTTGWLSVTYKTQDGNWSVPLEQVADGDNAAIRAEMTGIGTDDQGRYPYLPTLTDQVKNTIGNTDWYTWPWRAYREMNGNDILLCDVDIDPIRKTDYHETRE